jgi:hypothetical protein
MLRTVADHRAEAARCRALAGGCLHRPTGDVLRELAAELEAKADRMQAAPAAPHSALLNQLDRATA